MKGADWPILGYLDQWSVAPGGKLKVMVSTDSDRYTASVIRLGGPRPEAVRMKGSGDYPGRAQSTFAGSYVLIPNSNVFNHLSALTVQTWVYPTLPGDGRVQGLVTKLSPAGSGGWGLFLDETGRLLFRLQARDGRRAEYRLEHPVRPRNWYEVICSFDQKSGKVRLIQQALAPWSEPRHSQEANLSVEMDQVAADDVPVLIGAGSWQSKPRPHAEDLYDGKIDNPALFSAWLDDHALARLEAGASPREVADDALLASWDFSIGISTEEVTDTSSNRLHGIAMNAPMRAATGHRWRAIKQYFGDALGEYSAIHFHHDDLSDAGWDPDFELQIPSDLASGAYAVRVAIAEDTDDIPFFVRPRSAARAQVLFLVPTFTYLAYGNTHDFWMDSTGAQNVEVPVHSTALFLAKHRELGISLYDRHADGSGSCYASRMRPIVHMRQDHRLAADSPRHYPADLLFLQWLERKGLRYDVITDDDLAAGPGVVSDYRVIVTGSHPEYYSATMLDALSGHVAAGGKLMYLGGNGFYWVTSLDKSRPHIIEIRRGVAGTRDWNSEPGEHYHSTTGEFGGLWRHRGRTPNQLVGVGFCAVGGKGASGYVRQADSFRDDVAFIFRGVGEEEVIGTFGDVDGGAAGDELDRLDYELGTPPTALLLATSAGLNPTYTIAIEDIRQSKEARNNPRIRADMVYYTNSTGGAVFSVGSINWFASLGTDHDNNNVSRITENVVRHFLNLE